MAAITGLVLGDARTGIIMGGLLEAIFMGVSFIGGAVPAQPSISACFVTSLVITTDVDIETAIAIAMPFGVLAQTLNSLWSPMFVLAEPWFEKMAAEGRDKEFFWGHVLWACSVRHVALVIVLFASTLAGVASAEALLTWIPKTVMNGINAAGAMLPVLGFGILAHMLWTQHKHLLWLMFGFLSATYLRIPTLALAMLAAIIAMVAFMRDVEVHELRSAVPTDTKEDFLNG